MSFQRTPWYPYVSNSQKEQGMDFYLSAPLWDENTPHLKTEASPRERKTVHNATIIKVKKAAYRDCVFDGAFLLSPDVKLPLPESGKHRVEVICRWFGHRLKTRGPEFLVDTATAEVIENFTGEVWTDLNSWAGYQRNYS